MKLNKLGSSDLMVSEVCLGTMTWGVQNTEEEAHEQIEYALSCGVNFLDTAELYPVPVFSPERVPGRTEEIIGSWLAKHPERRSEIVLATKVIGYKPNSSEVAHRSDPPAAPPYPTARLDGPNIRAALAASLKRLNTDYIDLYQLHWPDRYTANFGSREYDPERARPEPIPIRESLLALKELLDAGKIRAYGLSNETTFGVCEFVRIADELGMPRPATIQNDFSLLQRMFESELAEACAPNHFNIGLLPWSILAGGMLTGKYHTDGPETVDMPTEKSLATANGADGDTLKKSRHVLFESYQPRFMSKQVMEETGKYMKLAKDCGMSPSTLAHAFCKSRWYIPSTIIGATTIEQLKENIAAFDVELDAKTLHKIDEIHNVVKDPVIRTNALLE